MRKVARSIRGRGCTDLHCERGAQEIMPLRVGGNGEVFDLPSLTSLSVAGCSRLQVGVGHWATSVALLQVVDN